MTTIRPIVLKCPQCGGLMSDFQLMSYTVHRATSWSDGKTDAGIPNNSEIKVCIICHLPFWKTDATLPYDPEWDVAEELAGAMDIGDLTGRFDDNRQAFLVDYYADLLAQGFADNEEREFYLRVRLWWSINDIVRYLRPDNRKNSEERGQLFNNYKRQLNKNLDRMIYLYIKKGEVDLLFLVEMYREKGNFEKAEEILQQYKGLKNEVFKKLRFNARMKKRKVFRFS